MNGDFKIHGGDFISGIVDTNQYVYGFFLLKVKGKLFREKIPISFVMNLEIATEESVKKALKRIKIKYLVEKAVLDIHTANDNPILVHP